MENIHSLLHEAAYHMQQGNIEGASKILGAMDELIHEEINQAQKQKS